VSTVEIDLEVVEVVFDRIESATRDKIEAQNVTQQLRTENRQLQMKLQDALSLIDTLTFDIAALQEQLGTLLGNMEGESLVPDIQ
jgi:hypothetical protein